jgi:hypothetical protein
LSPIRGVATNSNDHIFAYGDNTFRSTDNGETWARIGWENMSVFAMVFNTVGDLFAAANSGLLLRSTDNGDTWTQIFLTNSRINALTINSCGHIFVAHHDTLVRSTDNGATWVGLYSDMFSGNYITSLAINSKSEIFASSGRGFFRSVDNGERWTKIGVQNVFIGVLVLDADGYIYAGTSGSGVFRSSQSTVPPPSPPPPGPPPPTQISEMKLQQNYPNPFNPITSMQFSLSKPSEVRLSVFDAYGQHVMELVDGNHETGSFQTSWYGTDPHGAPVSSGTYFSRIIATPLDGSPPFVQTRKMILLR